MPLCSVSHMSGIGSTAFVGVPPAQALLGREMLQPLGVLVGSGVARIQTAGGVERPLWEAGTREDVVGQESLCWALEEGPA